MDQQTGFNEAEPRGSAFPGGAWERAGNEGVFLPCRLPLIWLQTRHEEPTIRECLGLGRRDGIRFGAVSSQCWTLRSLVQRGDGSRVGRVRLPSRAMVGRGFAGTCW